jgi:hypothetical protein
MAGLDRPGTVVTPDRTAALVPLFLGVALTVGGIAGLLLVNRRRPPLSMA